MGMKGERRFLLCSAMPTQPISPSSFLHPSSGKKSKYKTSVRRKTLNPEFNEVGHSCETPVKCGLDLANQVLPEPVS